MNLFCLFILLNSAFQTFGRGTWNASGQYEYYVSPNKYAISYQQAQAYCNEQRGELALVKTQEIQQFIQTLVTGSSGRPYVFYIGLRDIGSNGTFIWNDGEALSYKNWFAGEPNNIGRQTCVSMGWIYTYAANLPWYNTQCTTGTNVPRGFVCQRAVTTTSFVDISTTSSIIISSTSDLTQSVTTEGEFMKSTLSQETAALSSSAPATEVRTEIIQSMKPTVKQDATTAGTCSCSFEPVSFIIGFIIPTIIFVAVFVKFYFSYKKLLRKLSQSQEIRHYENVQFDNTAAGQSSSQGAQQQGLYASIQDKPNTSEPTYVNKPKSSQEPDYLVPMEPHYIEPATVKVEEAKYEEFQK